MQFLESRGKSVRDFEIRDVEAYYSWLLTWNSVNCLYTKASYIRPFIRWLSEYFEDERFLELWRRIKSPKRVEKKLPIPDDDTIMAYLKAIDNPKYKALFALLAETGLRLGEALRLSPKDFIDHGDHYEVRIMSEKSGEVRTVYVVLFYDYVKSWINRLPKNARFVFHGRRPDKMLARGAFGQYLRKIEKKHGLPHIWPHLLRHYNAVRLLRLGMSEKEVREIHGWKTPEMLDRYAPYLPYLKDKYLRLVGLRRAQPEERIELKPISCLRCGHQNPPGSDFCTKCGAPLGPSAKRISMSNIMGDLEKLKREIERLKKQQLQLLKELKL